MLDFSRNYALGSVLYRGKRTRYVYFFKGQKNAKGIVDKYSPQCNCGWYCIQKDFKTYDNVFLVALAFSVTTGKVLIQFLLKIGVILFSSEKISE